MEDTTEMVRLTVFAPPPSPPYRYAITLKSERLSIWMAEPESKKQWYLGNLEQADYVKPQYTIPGATATDYAKAIYEFTLASGTIERVNDLEERLHYKEDVLIWLRTEAGARNAVIQQLNGSLNALKGGDAEQLRAQLNEQEKKLRQLHDELIERHVVLLEATGINDRGNVCWKRVDSGDVVVDDDNNVVRVARAGVYVVYGLVQVPHEDFHHPSYDVGVSVRGVSYTLVAAMIPLRKGDLFRVNSVKDAQVLRSTWTMENVFDLKPGTIARINALETKVREQRELLKELQDGEDVGNTELKATRKDASSNVYWAKLDSKYCIVSEDTQRVVICRTGIYALAGGAKIAPESYQDAVRVMKNGVRVDVYDFERQGGKCFVAIMHLSAGDSMTVQCDCKASDLIDLDLVSLN